MNTFSVNGAVLRAIDSEVVIWNVFGFDRHAAQIQTLVSRGRADGFFITQDGDSRDALARSFGGGDNRARIVAFRQYDVLRP